VRLPIDVFLKSIEEKKVYFFSTEKINTPAPHFFICVRRTNNDLLIFTCCTSQFEKRRRFIESRGLPFETLVYIKPKDDGNPFDRDTYVDCNDCEIFTLEELAEKYKTGGVEFSGEISDVYYEQILIGLHASPLIDEETKELIPTSL
jgi:hypothetical protein